MKQGISLHIGLNSVNPNHYGGWDGPLVACENDARDMGMLAQSQGFGTTELLTQNATRTAVTSAIRQAASQLNSDDIFLISYSGHGGQLPDQNNDEPDGMDETWCLYDGEMVDDELYALYATFKPNVRILVLSDSCHSGTVIKAAAMRKAEREGAGARIKCLPPEIAARTYSLHKAFYDPILSKRKTNVRSIGASVKLISGCQDNQLSMDGPFNGLFTGTLKQVWNGGKFRGDYAAFHKKIVRQMPPDQTPNLYTIGASLPAFDNQRPFFI